MKIVRTAIALAIIVTMPTLSMAGMQHEIKSPRDAVSGTPKVRNESPSSNASTQTIGSSMGVYGQWSRRLTPAANTPRLRISR